MAGTITTQFYVAGPAYVFGGVGANQAPVFVGFTERGLTITRSGRYEDVNVDYAGLMPGDVSMLGQEARISGDFTRYNELALETMASFLAFNSFTGMGNNNSLGSLLTLEQGSYPLSIISPYATKTQFSGGGSPALGGSVTGEIQAYYFPSAYLVDQYEVTLSVRRKAPRLSWRAIPVFGNFDGGVFNQGSAPFNAYSLYTEDINLMPTAWTPTALLASPGVS